MLESHACGHALRMGDAAWFVMQMMWAVGFIALSPWIPWYFLLGIAHIVLTEPVLWLPFFGLSHFLISWSLYEFGWYLLSGIFSSLSSDIFPLLRIVRYTLNSIFTCVRAALSRWSIFFLGLWKNGKKPSDFYECIVYWWLDAHTPTPLFPSVTVGCHRKTVGSLSMRKPHGCLVRVLGFKANMTL